MQYSLKYERYWYNFVRDEFRSIEDSVLDVYNKLVYVIDLCFFYFDNKYVFRNKKNINFGLQNQIREYLTYYWQESTGEDLESEQKIIRSLSEPLRAALMVESNKIVLKDSQVFRNNFSEKMIERTIPMIKERRCRPGEVICLNDTQDDCSIYFIEKGRIELILDGNELDIHDSNQQYKKIVPLQKLAKGKSFGEIAFFTGQKRCFKIRSLDFSTLLYVERGEFVENLQKSYPDEYQKFCQIKDKILLMEDHSQVGINCFACDSNKHLMNKCHLIHFEPDAQKTITDYLRIINKSVQAERLTFEKLQTLIKAEQQAQSSKRLQDRGSEPRQNSSLLLEEKPPIIPLKRRQDRFHIFKELFYVQDYAQMIELEFEEFLLEQDWFQKQDLWLKQLDQEQQNEDISGDEIQLKYRESQDQNMPSSSYEQVVLNLSPVKQQDSEQPDQSEESIELKLKQNESQSQRSIPPENTQLLNPNIKVEDSSTQQSTENNSKILRVAQRRQSVHEALNLKMSKKRHKRKDSDQFKDLKILENQKSLQIQQQLLTIQNQINKKQNDSDEEIDISTKFERLQEWSHYLKQNNFSNIQKILKPHQNRIIQEQYIEENLKKHAPSKIMPNSSQFDNFHN